MNLTQHRLEVIAKHQDTRSVFLADVYTIDKVFSKKQLMQISTAIANDIVQEVFINTPYIPKKFDWAIEVGFLPGVTDNVASTTKEIIEDLLKTKFSGEENVYTSRVTFLSGNFTKNEIIKITDSLHNPIIQRVKIKSFKQFKKDKGMGIEIPRVKLNQSKKVDGVDLNTSDEELTKIGKSGIANADGSRRGPLVLDLTFMKTIRDYFRKKGRNPTDIELESIAQTWSEHCKHTIFADPIDEIKEGLYKTYIKRATNEIRKRRSATGRDFCVSVFTDNSGAIEFDKDYLITDKVETHNSPSALDPFGGSITGIVGVNRDAIGFGLGAKPILNRYGFCFAPPDDTLPLYKGANFTQKMLEPRRIMDGVIEGVNSGGNCSGIPTPQGFLVFDRRYKGKPLVFVGTVGLIPKKVCGKKSFVKKANNGDYIVMVGGRVGLDGIHGATFSSEAMDSGSPATAVQIGDPITQKKMSDAIVKEARNLNLYSSITDNGAGGLSCSVAEMAKESGGCFVKLDRVPLKYPGLSPWQIWVSESQERMTLAVPKRKWRKFSDLMKRRGVEATVIGEFNNSASCVVESEGKIIMDVEMKFLHDGLPKRLLKSAPYEPFFKEPKIPVSENPAKLLQKMLSRLNIASFKFISQQYDHEVQGSSVLKPLQGRGRINGDATIIRPILSSKKGVVVSQGICPNYSDIDTYHMAACAIDTAIRNAVAAGANIDYLALLDNFCWCSSNEPERLYQLKRAAQACYDYTIAFGTPLISGKDSMFNDYKGFDEKGNPVKISIPPTLLISSIGVVDDISKAISIDVKFAGDLIYILGETSDELGGSEYYAMNNFIGNSVPKVNAAKNKRSYRAFFRGVQNSLIASAIAVGRGGLAVALAKMSMAGLLGIDVSIRDDFALFSESQGRIVTTVNPANQKGFEKAMKGNYFALIGKVTDDDYITVKDILKIKIEEALKAYRPTFKDF